MRAIFKGESNYRFVARMGVFGAASGTLVVASILLIAGVGLNFGIDFAGGYEIHTKFDKAITEIKDAIKPAGIGDARVQSYGDPEQHEFLIMVREQGTVSVDEKVAIKKDFEALAGGSEKITEWSMAESGESITVGFDGPMEEARVRELIESHNLTIKTVHAGMREDKAEYKVALVSIADNVRKALYNAFGEPAKGKEMIQRVEFVGPQVGAQLRNQGIMAVLWALFFILLYVGVRFDLSFAPGAILALVHDVIITLGVFSVLQLEFNLPIVAAMLAIVGYSLNDTIVVYDRIRENLQRLKGRPLRELVDSSINQTLSRTLLTSVTTLLVVVALIVLGGGTIQNFAIALLVGILVGTYSSVAIASTSYVLLREREEAKSKESSGGMGAALKAR